MCDYSRPSDSVQAATGEQYAKQKAYETAFKRETLTQRLKSKRARIIVELTSVEKVINYVESHPELDELVPLLGQLIY